MTRLPELEHELLATAARLSHRGRRFERRARTLVPAVALVCVVAVALFAGGLFDADDHAVRPSGAPRGAGFPADATLEDMFGIFRRPQTAADDMGVTKEQLDGLPDQQPGEDPTQSRRVEWPGERIFMGPMRDGVCYGLRGGSGCPPLEVLRRMGVSIGTQYRPGHRSVSGVVVDGIREVVVTAKGGPELRVAVSENFFFVDLEAAAAKLGAPDWEGRVDRVRWRYAGQDESFDVGRVFPDDSAPPPPTPADAVPGSLSDQVRFSAGGTSYAAVGYQATDDTVCVQVAERQTDRPSLGCQGIEASTSRSRSSRQAVRSGRHDTRPDEVHGLHARGRGRCRASSTRRELTPRSSSPRPGGRFRGTASRSASCWCTTASPASRVRAT